MGRRIFLAWAVISLIVLCSPVLGSRFPKGSSPISGNLDPAPPSNPDRLIFIHHSTGEHWLSDDNGSLGIALRENTYYVAKTGNDSNPGSEAQPWLSIQKAASTLVAGDTVYIRSGTYNERVIPENSGSAGNYITYAAYPGETVTIDGNNISVPEDEGLFYIHGKSYIKVSGLRVFNSAQAGIYANASSNNITIEKNYTYNTGSSGIGVWNSSSIVIDGNEVESSCSNGSQENITVAGTSSFEVKNNHVHNELPGYGKEGICLKDGSSNGKAYGNHVHHTWKVGIYLDAWDKHTYNIEVFENIVHDSCTDGIAVASEMGGLLKNIKIYNNISYNNITLGINVSRNGPASTRVQPLKDIEVVNNTIYNNGLGGWGGGIAVGNRDVQGIVIQNNICSQNLSFQILVATDAPVQELKVDHNLIDGFRWYTEERASEIYGIEYIEGDPEFVNAFGADFHLQGSSPAIDKGSSLHAPINDYDGNSRPQGGGYDIGACEYGAGPPPAETVSTPTEPNGPAGGIPGTSCSYTTGDSVSSLSHAVEYQFDWSGDESDLSPWGPSTQLKTWNSAGTYRVRARARCQNDNTVVSSWSTALTVTVTESSLTDLTGEWMSLVQTCRNTRSGVKCKISGTLRVQNIGTVNAPSTSLNFYLSESENYDEEDVFKQASTGKISAGRKKAIKLSYSLATGETASGRYIIVVIDPDNTVVESNRENNIIVFGPIP